MPRSVSPTRFTSAGHKNNVDVPADIHNMSLKAKSWNGTIDRCFSRQDDHNQLQTNVGHLEVFEHGLHAVGSLGIFTETWLALDGHPSVFGDLPELVSEAPTEKHLNLIRSQRREQPFLYITTRLRLCYPAISTT